MSTEEWLESALQDLDEVRRLAADKVVEVGRNRARMRTPNGREVRECIRLSAELRGLLGAAAKGKAAAPPVPDAAWERMTAAEKLEQLDAARADVLAEAEREQRSTGRH